jgi:oxygen-independent coproporphyrinogen-3 oxidase
MCQLETTFTDKNTFAELPEALEKLKEMQEDGLVELSENFVKITEKGRVFTRNVAMAFDLRMMRKMPETRLFSMTV